MNYREMIAEFMNQQGDKAFTVEMVYAWIVDKYSTLPDRNTIRMAVNLAAEPLWDGCYKGKRKDGQKQLELKLGGQENEYDIGERKKGSKSIYKSSK